MAGKGGQAAPKAANQEGAETAAPASDAAPKAAGSPRTYVCAQIVTLGPEVGDLYLTKEQKERLAGRKCVTTGSLEGTDRLKEPVHFKKGEKVTFGSVPPKVLWHAFGGAAGGGEPAPV